MAISVGPSASSAVLKASLISSIVLAATPKHPNAFAVATMSSPGRSRAGTFGVFSRTANSLRIAYPKRLGQVFQTRYFAATGKAGPALAPGSKFAGSVSASGRRLAQALVTLKEPVTDLSVLKQRPIVNLLHTPRLAADRQNKPAVHELVENVPHNLKIEQAWVGDGLLTLPVVDGEEISDLAPIRCGNGIRASMAYIVDDLKTLKDLTK